MRTDSSLTDSRESLQACLAERGLRTSRQREVIAGVFFATGGHPTAEELIAEVRKVDPRIGRTTVYRTLRLMTVCGLAQSQRFMDGETRYERIDDTRHHDHLICEQCGGIVEFQDSRLEAVQSQVAKDHDFQITEYRMDFYGLCSRCRDSNRHADPLHTDDGAAAASPVASAQRQQPRDARADVVASQESVDGEHR